jgi:hypothetical protein
LEFRKNKRIGIREIVHRHPGFSSYISKEESESNFPKESRIKKDEAKIQEKDTNITTETIEQRKRSRVCNCFELKVLWNKQEISKVWENVLTISKFKRFGLQYGNLFLKKLRLIKSILAL